MMHCWRNHLFIKLICYLLLGLLLLNPAQALQYQQPNPYPDIPERLPDDMPKAWQIHASQKDEVLQLLRSRGYAVIPASREEAAQYLHSGLLDDKQPIQLAANFNLKSAFEKECPVRAVLCYREECDKYSDSPPTNCRTDVPPPVKPKPKAEPRSGGSISIHGDLPVPKINGGGGGGRDGAEILLVVLGIVVIAALIVYAGKWVVDSLKNDEDYYAYWWDLGVQFISLDTGAGQHGNLQGFKFSGGFIPNMHTNFGIALELGQMDLDLIYNANSTPQRINIEGAYWLLGPSVRWFVGSRDSENLIHNSYILVELLGGGSDRAEVDKMFLGRLGFNTALGEHTRLGLYYGAFYLGLKEDQGIANDGDNYWNLYGIEIGYQF